MPAAIIVPDGMFGGAFRVHGLTSGGGGFTPASLTGLIGWYKSDAGVYVDAGSTLATNGQTVQQWNDQSGVGNHLSQATSARRPTYTTGLLNGLPGIVFVVANVQWIANQAIALGGTTASAFVVAKTPSPGTNADRVVTFTATGQGLDFNNTGSGIFLFSASSTSISGYRNSGALSNGTVVANTFMQLGSIYDGTNNTVYLGGTAQTPVANTSTFAATGALGIGGGVQTPPGSTSGDSTMDGTICEIVFTNTALSSGDRSSLNSYFTSRWGV